MNLQKLKASTTLFVLAAASMVPVSASAAIPENTESTIAQANPILNVCRRMNINADDYVVLRSMPSFGGDVVAQMYPNEEVTLVRRNIEGFEGDMWLEIVDSVGNSGYVPASLYGQSTLGYCSYPASW
ncbi:SH3 domain-containing protein [Oscillatoriales cyanobacterium LEGE 11467]|uniref:SH3 domain-containing protein n=1 Tax=Zarconia navalis LEGE 11467 TaxID=1828826 RepID=A0A928Z6Z9_9CYAN|nr:SH3 domain-containing protein [Zarconia navalis]MBE9040927.1 SH3 domain-containing protein [Zarconia navalis LEGE 11467]